MFFSKTSEKSCESLLSILKRYEEASGQCINVAKSGITFSSKTPSEVKNRVKLTLGISNEGGIGKYLGLPEHFGHRKKDIFTAIVDKVRQKALSWANRFLSGAGKQVLLKAVLSAMPSYSMSCFKLPMSLCKRLQSTLTRFWWDAKPGKRKMSWVAWDKLTLTKEEGGLGFRDIANFNDSLLAKIGWRLLQHPDCLLAQVLLGKYCHSSSFMESKSPSNASHGWRSILEGREILRKGLGWIVGDGEQVSVWNSPWLSTTTPLTPTGPPNKDDQLLRVKDLLIPDSTTWNLDLILRVLPQHEGDIRKLILASTPKQDRLRWLPLKAGKYTSRSDYIVSRNSGLPLLQDIFKWSPCVWKLKVSPKLKMFLWKVASNALAIGKALQSRGIDAGAVCKRCGAEEDAIHLFFLCPYAKQTWNLAPLSGQLVVGNQVSIKEVLRKATKLVNLPPVGLGLTPLYPWILWYLWKARNQLLFEDKGWTEAETCVKAIQEARNWQSAKLLLPVKKVAAAKDGRVSTPTDTFVSFSDAAWKASTCQSGLGWIIKSPQQVIISQGKLSRPFVSSVLAAEALALKEAIVAALAQGVTKLFCYSDCQELILLLNSEGQANDVIGIFQDISLLKTSFVSISFQFIPRSANGEADALSKSGLLSCTFPSFSGV